MRNVPEDVVERLEQLAAREGLSVNAVVLKELASGASDPQRGHLRLAARPGHLAGGHAASARRGPRSTVIVVDASALVQALLVDGSARTELRDDELHAPFLIDSEVLSALRGHVLGGRLGSAIAETAITELGRIDLSRHSAVPLAGRVWEIRSGLTAYDACYVALAERLGGDLVTADARIARAPGLRCAVRVVS